MFCSQQFLSKKGPLGSIWVAAYCLKRLHKDQIAQTDIPSSVDKILIDEWPSVTYRKLGYLLLGVVRIYSKKVEFVLHDCRDTISELNKLVGKKKAVSFRELVHTRDFSLTLPERYELDAFVFELANDVNKAHVAEIADITIPESLKNDQIFKRCINKRRGNVTVQGTTTPTVSKTSAATIEPEARSSGQNSPESPEQMETCMEFDMGGSSSQPRRSVEESIEEFREIRFSREECLDFDMFYQNDTEHIGGIFESSNIIQSANVEQSDVSSIMQTEKDGHFCSEVEDETPTVEKNRDFKMPSNIHDHVDAEESEANFTVQASPELNMPSSIDEHVDVTDKSPVPEVASDNHESVTAVRKVTITDSESVSQSDTCAPVSSGKDKLHLSVQTTPNLKIPVVKDPGSAELLAVRTPANKERRVRKANKRKCICDNVTVLSNKTLKHNLDGTSDLVRKRRRVPHTSLDVWRLSCTSELPQKFTEPLISPTGTAKDPEDIQREPNKVDKVVTEEAPDIPVMALSPPRSVNDGLTIAPGTPIRCSTSTRAFRSSKAADSDGEGPFLPFQPTRRESSCQSFENARRDFVADSVEEIVMDLMDKEMEQNGDSQELDGWSTRTRTVARWLHQFFASKKKRNEARTANLSQILGGKTRKGSAGIFYEILVLSSGEYVNVSQGRSYDDILLQETSKMEAKLGKCPV